MKWQETSVNKCHKQIFADYFYYIIYLFFIYWYSFFNDDVMDFWSDYR